MLRGLFIAVLFTGCGSSGSSSSSTAHEETSGGDNGMTVTIEEDDPRVSRSAGEEGGVVVLWPRVMGIPGDEVNVLQAHLVEVARRVFPDREVDVRPDPERVCPRSGCNTVSVGALLVSQDGNCSVVAVIGRPGATNLTLLRWSGDLTVRDREVPFREPPESHVTIHENSPCADIERDLGLNDGAVEEAMRNAAGPS
jgi:hypothetical protein